MNDKNKMETVIDKFKKVVDIAGDKTAVEFIEESISYKELDIKSTQVSLTLKELGIKKNDIVGIMMERSIDLLVAIIGVMKVGATYLPLDIVFPSERINYILKDSSCKVLLHNSELKDDICFYGKKVDVRDISWSTIEYKLESGIEMDSTAYILYTSGSTGEPKGVPIDHSALTSFLEGIIKRIPFNENDRILAVTTVSFDISILELLVPLAIGMTIVLADSRMGKNPRLLVDYIIKKNINVIQMTPTRMMILMECLNSVDWVRNMRMIMIGGENFPINLLEKIQSITDSRIYNMYGPTESTIWVSVADLTKESVVHIGTSLQDSKLVILDENNKSVKRGELGEICILGAQLSKGYLNKRELTEKRFIRIKEYPNEILYRTGDYGCELENGNFVCKGRLDDQVKIRGYRVELNEVSQTLSNHPQIKNAVVIALDSKNNTKYISAYYEADNKLNDSEIREYMRKYLPYYMIPEKFEWTEKLPETLNQKIDKNVLKNKERGA